MLSPSLTPSEKAPLFSFLIFHVLALQSSIFFAPQEDFNHMESSFLSSKWRYLPNNFVNTINTNSYGEKSFRYYLINSLFNEGSLWEHGKVKWLLLFLSTFCLLVSQLGTLIDRREGPLTDHRLQIHLLWCFQCIYNVLDQISSLCPILPIDRSPLWLELL